MIYSLEERKIGKFFNEDLYEKTYIINLTTDLDETNCFYFDESVKQIIDTNIIVSKNDFNYNPTNNEYKYKLSVTPSNTIRNYYTFVDNYNDGEDTLNAYIKFHLSEASGFVYALLKVQYTKF